MGIPDFLLECTGFEWDEHDAEKNWQRNHVAPLECEEVLLHRPLVVVDDVSHSKEENRFYALGHTDAGRRLFVAFTVRRRQIRVISARDMSRRERRVYQSHEQEEDT